MAVFTDLPLDVIDRVFMTLPDFQTLAAAIMVCKECYNVFQTHPKSIVHAIASNIVGPAIPQALELVHVQEGASEIESEEIPTITRTQAVALAWNVPTVSRLEDLYSIRWAPKRVFFTLKSQSLSQPQRQNFLHEQVVRRRIFAVLSRSVPSLEAAARPHFR